MHENQEPVIVIFGITGDLSKRKLLPALYHLFEQKTLPEATRIIGISRRPLSTNDLLNEIESSIKANDEECKSDTLDRIGKSLDTAQVNPENKADYEILKAKLDELDKAGKRERLFYMSIPPDAYNPIIENLAATELNGEQARIMLEKPFGYDLSSAEQAIEIVSKAFREDQVYRIDHYLAKETAQNLLAFRQHNPIFTPLWNNQYIDYIHVRQLETIGIEGRTNFYEQTGALRDVVQSHLMQILALTLMDTPSDMTGKSIHEAKQHLFEELNLADPNHAIRGQYQGYKAEVENPDSFVETYLKLKLTSHSKQWQGVNIVLEHGKSMSETIADITIGFKAPNESKQNTLRFEIQPNEGISLDLLTKEPGFENIMKVTPLDFRYEDTFKGAAYVDAYERVLMDAINGDQSLFASNTEVLTTWRILQPLLDSWQTSADGLVIYPAGSSGL